MKFLMTDFFTGRVLGICRFFISFVLTILIFLTVFFRVYFCGRCFVEYCFSDFLAGTSHVAFLHFLFFDIFEDFVGAV